MVNREDIVRRRRFGLRQCQRWQYEEEVSTPRQIGKYGRTRKPCSCFMCGNPRHHEKGLERLTVQERRHLEAWPLGMFEE